MGTSNFHSVNSVGIFAYIPDEDDEFYYEDFKSNLQDALKEKGYDKESKRAKDELRSYPACVIASKTNIWIDTIKTLPEGDEDEIRDEERGVAIDIVLRGGYYQGINVDFYLEYLYDNQDWTDESIDYLEEKANELVNEAVEVIRQFTTELGVTARFSNGETIYHKVEHDKHEAG